MISQYLRRNAVAYTALFVALTGTAAAAVEPAPDDSVVTASIKNGEVKNDDLGANAIRGGKVLDGALTGADVADGSLTAADIDGGTLPSGPPSGPASGDLAGTYPAPTIKASAVNSAKVADFSLTAQDVGINALTGGNIAENSLFGNDIGTSAIGAPELRSSSVQASEIDIDAVGASEIAANGVGADEIASGGVGAAEIATGAVGSLDVADGGLGNADLANNSADARVVAVDAVGANEIGPLPAVRARRASGNTFDVHSGLRQTVPMTSEAFDTAGLHSNSTEPEDLIPRPSQASTRSAAESTGTNSREVATQRCLSTHRAAAGPRPRHDGRPGYQSASTLVALEAGDAVRLSVYTSTDANLLNQGSDVAHLEMVWVSEI